MVYIGYHIEVYSRLFLEREKIIHNFFSLDCKWIKKYVYSEAV